MRGYKNWVVYVQYARTILMTQFASRSLYAVPRVRGKSEVYFGLKSLSISLNQQLIRLGLSIQKIEPLKGIDTK